MINRIQISCPANVITGGPEALHQLGHTLHSQGVDVSMCYSSKEPGPHQPAEPYRRYEVPVSETLDDSPENLIVVPEVDTPKALKYSRASRAIWWLSWDNYCSSMKPHEKSFKMLRKNPIKFFSPSKGYRFTAEPRLFHLFQSDYVRQKLASHNQRGLMLTDYLSSAFLGMAKDADAGKKDDIVAYNPQKGAEYTRQLIEQSGDSIDWVPIQNLNAQGVADLLARAKVYVDFGNHPGRDRIPREAAAMGACVITGRQGSAVSPIDVPIPDRYKFDDSGENWVAPCLGLIREIFSDFATHSRDFSDYRKAIHDQEKTFSTEVATLVETLEVERNG